MHILNLVEELFIACVCSMVVNSNHIIILLYKGNLAYYYAITEEPLLGLEYSISHTYTSQVVAQLRLKILIVLLNASYYTYTTYPYSNSQICIENMICKIQYIDLCST